jgi:hypothetical protein
MDKTVARKLFITAVLAVLGVAGNTLTLPVSFGVMFIFGSTFSVVAVRRHLYPLAAPLLHRRFHRGPQE